MEYSKQTKNLWKALANMLIVDSEKKQQQIIINTWANENIFLNSYQ